ncbi:ras-like GTP-binding protein RYL2 [Halteromyces radiatus]|uniref:ras-like GTP-binding protein RYL2 n=1 Tax=Halteromyces radiatus TaxID=101107 RepID=UPI002220DD66|nr:ras-like GTP-binding protein RYL2 [Halteromyces radiatus]KAI8099814.1 ras-like GTP-binding protein RYL2 [Halteromyces radiatus]
MDSSPTATLEAKVVILGKTGVGKTSIAIRYIQRTFSPNGTSTIGASFMTKKLIVDQCRVRLQIWDTAGQERFRAMASLYYRGAQAAILVYDITSNESFDDIHSWVEELKKNTSKDLLIYVVGNKVDRASERAVSLEYVEDYVRHVLGHVSVYEVSAKEDDGEIEELFLQIAQSLVNQKYDQHWKQSCPSLISEYEESVARSGCCGG